jgi:hypothetical protein
MWRVNGIYFRVWPRKNQAYLVLVGALEERSKERGMRGLPNFSMIVINSQPLE